MKEIRYAREIVIGVMLLIIFSLTLALINSGINIFPEWLPRTLVTGIFTIIGVTIGANFAAKNALKVISINKENDQEKLKELHRRNQKIIVEHGDELIVLLDDQNKVLEDVFDEKKFEEALTNLYYINTSSYYINVLLEELVNIDSYDLDGRHDYYFRKLKKTCKMLKVNPFLSSKLGRGFEVHYVNNENMFHHNSISIGLEQIRLMTKQIREINI